MASEVVLVALVPGALVAEAALAAALLAYPFTSLASALAWVAKFGSADRKASARVLKFVASARVGGVGKAVIGMGYPQGGSGGKDQVRPSMVRLQ
jgi:hypothetical protein